MATAITPGVRVMTLCKTYATIASQCHPPLRCVAIANHVAPICMWLRPNSCPVWTMMPQILCRLAPVFEKDCSRRLHRPNSPERATRPVDKEQLERPRCCRVLCESVFQAPTAVRARTAKGQGWEGPCGPGGSQLFVHGRRRGPTTASHHHQPPPLFLDRGSSPPDSPRGGRETPARVGSAHLEVS